MAQPNVAKTGLDNEAAFNESLEDLHDADAAGVAGAGPSAEADRAGGQPAWVGRKLGHFKLLGSLGAGAMGLVIRAQDVNLGRIVALKVLRKRVDKSDDRKRVSQFLREARAAARIEHPSVAHIYEINEHGGWWYIATELIEGGTLQQIVDAAGGLSPAHACPLIADAASALAVAHKLGIIHRDIKPQNLMVTRAGRCKVVDFGLVRVEDPTDPFDFTDQAVGTPMYVAPEVARRKPGTSAIDIYGLGATLYFAVTGSPPFTGRTVKDLIRQHSDAPRPNACELNPDCTVSLAELIQRAMAVNPDERPTAVEFASILRVENIGEPIDPSSLVIDPSGSTNLSGMPGSSSGQILSSRHDSRVLGSSSGTAALDGASKPAWMWITRIAAILVVVGVIVAGGRWIGSWVSSIGSNRSVESAASFAARFPDAPGSYGWRPADTGPPPANRLADPPPFSWVGRVQLQANRYVANRRGRQCYPVDHPDAVLIPVDLAVFYGTAQEAAADGKSLIDR